MKHGGHYHPSNNKKSSWWTVVVAILFIGFFVYMVAYFFYQTIEPSDGIIVEHIDKLKNIFTSINDSAKITGFDKEKNSIDFLNTGTFSGSHVGSMHLQHPEKWQGPYITEELKVQNRPYQIVSTKDGYYIIPGEGVRLHNDKVIGTDIIITRHTDMNQLMEDPYQLLGSTRKPLAAKIPALSNPFDMAMGISARAPLGDGD
jgi:hypothetical protein